MSEGRVAYFGPRENSLNYFERFDLNKFKNFLIIWKKKSFGYKCPMNYNPIDFMISILHVSVLYREHDLLRVNVS